MPELFNLDLNNVYKKSFSLFCRHLGIIVGTMHMEIVNALESHTKHVCVMAARGHSKTTIMSVAYPLWYCYKNTTSPKSIVIVSMNQNESRRIMGIIRDYIYKYQDFLGFKLKVDTADELQIYLPNSIDHHTISCVPIGTRGRHCDVLICDDVMKDEQGNTVQSITKLKQIWWNAQTPMVSAKKGIILLLGTPISTNDLFGDVKEIIERETEQTGDSNWLFMRYPALTDDGKVQFPEFYDYDQLMSIKSSKPDWVWEQEYMLRPFGGSQSIFRLDDLESASNLAYPELKEEELLSRKTYIGCDVAMSDASTADYSAFFVVSKCPNHPLKIEYIWHERGVDEPLQIDEIKNLKRIHNVCYGKIEKKGLTYSMSNKVIKDPELAGIIEEWNPTNEEKAKIIGNLQLLIKHNMLYIPKDLQHYNELMSELMSFTLINKNGNQIYKASTGHDDLVIGLALAVSSAGGWVFDEKQPPKLLII